MIELNQKEYSFFGDNENLEPKHKKEFIIKVRDFLNSICELYGIKKDLKLKKIDNNQEVINFLIKAGIIKNKNEIDNLKLLLGKEYSNVISILSEYLKMNIETNDCLKKYMDYYRKKAVERYLKDTISPTVVDLFCGAGGMSLGFYQNEYKIVLANDIEKVCTDTYSFNHYEIPKSRILNDDVKKIIDSIDSVIKESVDVIIGGPPCQGFSMANRQRIIDDPRNILYMYYVKAVERLKPKFFVMENVKGMQNVAKQIKEDFHSLNNVDYDVDFHVFNASDFSVPQNRERLIFIGIRSDISNDIKMNSSDIIQEILVYTEKMESYYLDDGIGDLRELEPFRIKYATDLDTQESGKKIEKNLEIKTTNYVNLINNNKPISLTLNHKTRYNNDRDIEIFSKMLPGDNSTSERIKDIMPYKNRNHIFKDKYYKLIPEEICKTITAHMRFDCNMYIHPNQSRGLTPREAARVQSYPDDYIFLGPYTKTYMQIGNSVPPLMSNIIAKIIKKHIKNR